jgi:hypothetical protein
MSQGYSALLRALVQQRVIRLSHWSGRAGAVSVRRNPESHRRRLAMAPQHRRLALLQLLSGWFAFARGMDDDVDHDQFGDSSACRLPKSARARLAAETGGVLGSDVGRAPI